jgi:hypothetical protein
MSPAEVDEQMRRVRDAARFCQTGHAALAQRYGRMIELMDASKPYYMQAAQLQTGDLAFVEVIQSGMSNVAAIALSLELAGADLNKGAHQTLPVWSAVVNFAGSTAAVNDFHPVGNFKLDDISVVLKPDERSERLGERLGKIDPALSATCDQIFSDLYGTTGDPIRAATFMTRQVWDHFFGKLAPKDDEVRRSKYWKTKLGKEKPDAVSREERVRCTIDLNVTDRNQNLLLHGSTASMCDTYGDLNTAHARGELNCDKAKSAVAVLHRWFLQWADALGL